MGHMFHTCYNFLCVTNVRTDLIHIILRLTIFFRQGRFLKLEERIDASSNMAHSDIYWKKDADNYNSELLKTRKHTVTVCNIS